MLASKRVRNAFCCFRRRTIQGNSTHFGRSARFALAVMFHIRLKIVFHIRLSANICIECINDTLFSWNELISMRPCTNNARQNNFFPFLSVLFHLISLWFALTPETLYSFQKRLNNELFHFFIDVLWPLKLGVWFGVHVWICAFCLEYATFLASVIAGREYVAVASHTIYDAHRNGWKTRWNVVVKFNFGMKPKRMHSRLLYNKIERKVVAALEESERNSPTRSR